MNNYAKMISEEVAKDIDCTKYIKEEIIKRNLGYILIEALLEDDLKKSANLLCIFVDNADELYNSVDLFYVLYEHLKAYFVDSYPECQYYNITSDCVVPYFWNAWMYDEEGELCYLRMLDLYLKIQNNLVKAEKTLMGESTVECFLKLVDKKYQFFKNILGENIVDILLVPYSDKYEDGAYWVRPDKHFKMKDMIVLTHPRHKTLFSPEYIFLSQLGHCLSTRIIGAKNVAPESFRFVWNCVPEKVFNSMSEVDLFKTCFALSVLENTPFQPIDNYGLIENKKLSQVSMYMKKLIAGSKY